MSVTKRTKKRLNKKSPQHLVFSWLFSTAKLLISLKGVPYILDSGSLAPPSIQNKKYIHIDPTNVPFRDTERVVEGTDKLLKWELAQVDIQSFDAVKMKSQIDELC